MLVHDPCKGRHCSGGERLQHNTEHRMDLGRMPHSTEDWWEGTSSRPGMPGVGTVAASGITLGLVIGTRGRSLQDRELPLLTPS